MFINAGEARFTYAKKETTEASPGPSSYDREKSFDYANKQRGNNVIGKMKRVSFVEQASRTSFSPGPAKHVSTNIAYLNKLSPSPHRASRKRI